MNRRNDSQKRFAYALMPRTSPSAKNMPPVHCALLHKENTCFLTSKSGNTSNRTVQDDARNIIKKVPVFLEIPEQDDSGKKWITSKFVIGGSILRRNLFFFGFRNTDMRPAMPNCAKDVSRMLRYLSAFCRPYPHKK